MKHVRENSFEVENIKVEDVDDILRLHLKTNLERWSIKGYSEVINDADYCGWTAKIEGKTAAFLLTRLIKSENSIEIINIAVSPELQNQGLGKLLLRKCIKFCDVNDLHICFLEVRESNVRARRFYESNGFAAFGVRKNFYENPPDNAVLMRRVLKKLD